MHKILHPREIEAATIKIFAAGKVGTAFFVNAVDGDLLLLTADHNLPEDEQSAVTISLTGGIELPVAIVKRLPQKDIALLKLSGPAPEIKGLPIAASAIAYSSDWESFGFPAERIQSGGRYHGKVSRINTETKWDVDLDCSQYGILTDFGGLSGAPLVIDGLAVGVIGYDLAGTLGATSLAAVAELLGTEQLAWCPEHDVHAIPESIKEDISQAAANDDVLERLASAICGIPNEQICLLKGNPGAGKTTLIAQFELEDDRYQICDRYFVKVPNREDIPTQVRATPEFFMEWATGVYTRRLFDSPAEKKEQSWGTRLQELRRGFQRLSEHYRSQGKTGLLLIDGLDDVAPEKLADFLDLLPDTSCGHLKVVLSCTSEAILPGDLRSKIGESAMVSVTPLGNQKVRQYFADVLSSKSLTFEQQSQLAEKSEGYPLYMRYLERYVLALPDPTDLDEWISTIPQIGGDIAVYYKAVWSKLEHSAAEIWIAATVARLRHSVDKDMLYQMLSPAEKNAFPVVFPKLQHLLKNEEHISIYHTSFSDFIIAKTGQIAEEIHHRIAGYCRDHRELTFAAANVIFHLLNAKMEDRRDAVKTCDQVWADSCTMSGVSPDLVLADIKNTVAMAALFGLAAEAIRLLLLSQRISFRYNTLFEENATYLVSALLALGKPDEALGYLIRNDKLAVSDGDAIFLLQRFFEYGFIEEGTELYNVIKKTSHKMLDSGLNGETFSEFADLRFNSLTLAANIERAYLEEYLDLKEKVLHVLEANHNDQATIDQFKDRIGSYLQGYLIWRFGVPPILKKQELDHPNTVNDKSAGYLALTVNRARQFKRLSVVMESRSSVKAYVNDIQYLIKKYGSDTSYDRALIAALLPDGTDAALVESIIGRFYTARPLLDIRQENGVDLNPDNIHNFHVYAQSMGYIDQADAYPRLLPLRRGQWEESLKLQLEYVFFLTGKTYRLLADSKSDELQTLKPRITALLNNLQFELIDRQHWDRACALPETLLPVIWGQLLDLLVAHFPAEIPSFTDPIIQQKNYQLGLYSEGYMDMIFHLIGVLDSVRAQWPVVYKLAKTLETHIISGVENRFEKNEYLLRLVEVYARLENIDEARRCFRIMLDHSMGPGWYKEGQLSILNSAVRAALPVENRSHYLKRFAAHLQQASGEMTFQRYVKQEQEEFAGDLASFGDLKQGIAYFKYLVFPDYQTVLTNAESGVVDMAVKGQGYILGARAIEEQAGIARILENLETEDSLAAWGLAELLVLGDERYIRDYAKIQAGILNRAYSSDQPYKDELIARTAKFITTDADPEHRPEYLSALLKACVDDVRSPLELALKKTGIVLQKKEKPEERKYKSDDKDPLNSLTEAKTKALSLLEMNNKSAVRTLLIAALSEIQSKKYSVWSDFYSEKINTVTSLFEQVYDQPSLFITDIRDLLVNEPYFEEWVVAEKLIRLIGKMADETTKQAITEAVDEHVMLMVRTPQQIMDRYHWLENAEDSQETQETQLLDLLIWFLNHPDLVVKNRTMEILVWLGGQSPQTVVPALVKTLFQPGYQLSGELAAAALHQLSAKVNLAIWPLFENSLAAHELQLRALDHFMIINSLIESLELFVKQGQAGAVKYLDLLNSKFTAVTMSQSDVYFEEVYLEPITDELYALSAAGISNGQFAKLLIGRITELKPAPIADCLRANEYIDRSFNDYYNLELVSDFDTLLRFSLNTAVTGFVPLAERKKVGDILRFYQPTFAENRLNGLFRGWREIDAQIKQLALGETTNVSVLTGQNIYLHYLNEIFDKEIREENSFECTAYLVPLADWKENSRFQPECQFPANMYPDEQPYENEDTCIPLVAESYDVKSVGAAVTPSFPLLYSPDLPYSFIKDSTSIDYWRHGRVWDQKRRGKPLVTGHALHIPKHKLNKLKATYKLILAISYDYHFAHIDVFGQKLIKYENPQ
ncbi:MAG: serine protease [Bacteroidota bacterium]